MFLPVAAYQQVARTYIESDGTICCLYKTICPLSVRPSACNNSVLDEFSCNFILEILLKSVEETSVVKSKKNMAQFT